MQSWETQFSLLCYVEWLQYFLFLCFGFTSKYVETHLRHSTKQWLCTLVPTMKEHKRIGCSLAILVLSFLSLQESLRKRIVVVGWSLSQVWFFCDSMDCSPPGSPIHGISPREWIAIYFSKGSSDPKIKPKFPAWQVNSLPLSHQGSLRKRIEHIISPFCLIELWHFS